jgi:hypothetical protein
MPSGHVLKRDNVVSSQGVADGYLDYAACNNVLYYLYDNSSYEMVTLII